MMRRTPRTRLTNRQREELWDSECEKAREAGRGEFPICRLCDLPIIPGRDRWHDNHDKRLPRALGGQRDGISHARCNLEHAYTVDIPLIAKSDRRRQKFIGAFRTNSPMQGGRDDIIKKKMNGEVVLRSTGQLWRRE